MDNPVRYLGSAVGFAFGVLWLAMGVGSAILCVVLAAIGYGAVFLAERAQAEASRRRLSIRTPAPKAFLLAPEATHVGQVELDEERYSDLRDDAAAPLAAEAEYGWPLAGDAVRSGEPVAR